MKRVFLGMYIRTATLALVVATPLLVPRAAGAWPQDPIKTKITIPFNGVVYHPAAQEHVVVSGALAVKTVVKYAPANPVFPQDPIFPTSPIKVSTTYKLASGTTATGQTSGNTYALKGSGKTGYLVPADPAFPVNPIRTVTQNAVFYMIPTSPIIPENPIKGFRITYQVNFDDNGISTNSAAVVVPDGDTSGCIAATYTSEQALVTQSTCANGITDANETGIDCGGAFCSARCPLGEACADNTDCTSASCFDGVCASCVPYGGVCSVSADCCGFGLGIVCISENCTVP